MSTSANRQNIAPPQLISAPGRSVVQAFVAGLGGQALGHVAQHGGPDRFGAEIPSLDAGNGFDISRQAFGEPVLLLVQLRQRQVRHLVDNHQSCFRIEAGLAGVTANREANRGAAIGPSRSATHAGAGHRYDQDARRFDREAAVITGHHRLPNVGSPSLSTVAWGEIPYPQGQSPR